MGTWTHGQLCRAVRAPSTRSPGASRTRRIFSCFPAGNTAELHPPQPYGIRRLRFCPGTSRYGAKYRFTHPAGFLKQPSGWWVTSVVKVDGCNYGSVSESEAVGPHENIFLLQLWNYDLVVPPPLYIFHYMIQNKDLMHMESRPEHFSVNIHCICFYLTVPRWVFGSVSVIR